MKRRFLSVFGLIGIDLFSFFTSLLIAYVLIEFLKLEVFNLEFQKPGFLLDYFFLSIIYLIVMGFEGLYTSRETFQEESRTIVKAVILSAMIAFMAVSLIHLSKSLIILLWLVSMIIFPTFRFYGKRLLHYFKIWYEPIIILGNNKPGREFAENMINKPFLGYEVIGFLDNDISSENKEVQILNKTYEILGEIKDYCDIAKRHHVSVALLAAPHLNKEEISALVIKVQQCSRRIIIVPHAKGIVMQNSKLLHVLSSNTFLLELNNNLKVRNNQFCKNLFDMFLVIVSLPILLPVFVIISILIKIDSGGAVFFTQKRLGKNDTSFQCIKFQTMYQNNDEILEKYLAENEEAVKEWEKYKKLKSYDPRITKIGHILRRTSLDELAQIINVLRGEMSLVGPRPYLPREREDIGEHTSLILETKPGITGLWQISGRNALTFDERVKLDTWYILNWSLWSDIVILIKTIKVVFKREGAS